MISLDMVATQEMFPTISGFNPGWIHGFPWEDGVGD